MTAAALPVRAIAAADEGVSAVPFRSRAQEKWAFATKQPFAKKWADITNQKALPKRVKKGKAKKKGGK